MTDFRAELYRRYVSAFKENNNAFDQTTLSRYWTWCDHKYLPALIGVEHQDPVLDLGCGAGQMVEFLMKRGFSNAQGVDISEEQINLGRLRGLDVQAADVFDFLKDRQAVFAAIIALDFVEHFSKDELLPLFTSMYNSLKEGGVLLIQTPNGSGLFPRQIMYDDLTHMTIFTPASIQHILKVVGFGEFHFWETGPIPVNYKGVIRSFLWHMLKLFVNAVRLIETSKTQSIWTENLICVCKKPVSVVISPSESLPNMENK